ncbi:hypothetical protein Tco_1138058 [Tanacetum coccineum]
MPQPWRTFVVVINRCISGKSTSLDRLRPSRAQILWGMFNKKNVDFVALLWEDFMLQADNKDISQTCKENMSYPRFTKVIINHFIYKDKTISMRNKINLHTIRDDSLLGTLKYVSKTEDYQKSCSNKARKFKKIASPSNKKTLVLEDEPAKKPKRAKHPEPAKKSAPAKEDVSSKKPSRKQSSSGDSGDEANEQGNDEVDKQSDDDHEQLTMNGQNLMIEEEETQDDEYIHTLDDYVPTDDETNDESDDVTEEEYERINEELYGDVNVSLTDAEPADKEKDDKEMTVAGHVNVNQEGACNQVKDDAQATQKTEGPIPSSSISSDYAAKYLNFDNIPPVDTKVVSMLDINDIKELKTIDHSTSLLSTIKSKVPIASRVPGTSLDVALYKTNMYLRKSLKDIRKIKMEHARKQQEPKETITSSDTSALEEFDKKKTLFQTMTNSKRAPKHDWFKKPERPLTPDSDWNVRKSVDFRPPQTWISKIAQAEKPPLSFDELMSTPIDFSAYVMNHLKIDNLTQEHLVGPAFNLLKGTCKSRVELEYNIEECYKAVTDRLDWNNPEGKEYPFDLSKPLSLIMERGRQVVPVDYFINNDLEYLRGGSSSKKYMTSTTKTKAAKYDIPGIEDMVLSLWSSVKEGDFPRLHLHDIEDMLLLLVQKKLSNLERDVIFDLGVALRMSNISNRTPYTAYINPQGVIYVDKYKRNKLMRSDELYKFSDGTLTSVRTVLYDIASNLRMDYLPKRS